MGYRGCDIMASGVYESEFTDQKAGLKYGMARMAF